MTGEAEPETFTKGSVRDLSKPWTTGTAPGVIELDVPGGLVEIRTVAVVWG